MKCFIVLFFIAKIVNIPKGYLLLFLLPEISNIMIFLLLEDQVHSIRTSYKKKLKMNCYRYAVLLCATAKQATAMKKVLNVKVNWPKIS